MSRNTCNFLDDLTVDRYLFKNTELNNLRKIICLRKSEVMFKKKKKTVTNVVEKLVEHGIHSIMLLYK